MLRREFLTGLVSALAAPVIVRSTSIMQVRGIVMPPEKPLGYVDYRELCLDYDDDEAFFYAIIETVEKNSYSVGDGKLYGGPFRLPDVWRS